MPSDLSRTTQVNITPIIGLNLYGPIWKGHASAIRVILGPFCLLEGPCERYTGDSGAVLPVIVLV